MKHFPTFQICSSYMFGQILICNFTHVRSVDVCFISSIYKPVQLDNGLHLCLNCKPAADRVTNQMSEC